MTLGEMRTLLESRGVRLTRSLGQNFLHDTHQIARIVRLAQLSPGQHVVEVGPGLGPLTEALLAAGLEVLAIEKDARLAPLLRERLGPHPRLEVILDDALAWLRRSPPTHPDWHVVANLPYSVGSALLVDFGDLALPPRTLTVTLQAEVVDRLRAGPGTPEYGLLTLLLAREYRPGPCFRIPAACFFPAPNVTSACLRLERRPHPLAVGSHAETYRRLAKLAFSQRRKQFRTVLRGKWTEEALTRAWASLGLRDEARAETLPPEVFADLARCLEADPAPPPAS